MELYVVDASESSGDLRTTPFAQLLVELFEGAETGTLYVHDQAGESLAVIRIEAGLPVRARMRRVHANLLQALIPLCARIDGAFAFAAGEDAIKPGPDVVTGQVDPRALIAAAARGPLREDAIAELMVAIGRNLLKLNPRADLERYGWNAQERRLIAALADGPIEFAELVMRSGVPEHIARRTAYVLRVTHALTILPAARRTQSGTVEHARPLPAPRGAATAPGRYSVVEPDHGTTAIEADEAEAILVEVEEAPERAPKRPLASQALGHQARAEQLLRQRNYAEALREAREALKLGGGNAECQALYAWVLYQHNGAGQRVHPRVWEHLESGLKRDPLCVRAHLYKAQLLKRVGRHEEAHWHFRRVLQIDRENIEAAREVRLHDMRKRHTQSSGLVGRLFGRKQ